MIRKISAVTLALTGISIWPSNCQAIECGQTIDIVAIAKLEDKLRAARDTYLTDMERLNRAAGDANISGQTNQANTFNGESLYAIDIHSDTDVLQSYLEQVRIIASIKKSMINDRDRKVAEIYMTMSAAYLAKTSKAHLESMDKLIAKTKTPAIVRDGESLRDAVGDIVRVFSQCTLAQK